MIGKDSPHKFVMSLFLQNKYRGFLARFYRLASVAILANMMVPLAGLFDAAFLGHLDNINHLAGVILGSLLFDYLLQIALLSQFTVQGVGMTSQTLIGNFKGQGRTNQILPVLQVSLVTALPIALTFSLGAVLFPNTIFKLLTNHSEVSQAMEQYAIWLVPLLSLTATVFMMESYFIGIKDGTTVRNGAVIGFAVGFLPMILLVMIKQSEYLLWGALTSYMAVYLAFLIYRLVRTHKQLVLIEK